MPVCPNVADFPPVADEDDAGEPWYMSLFFLTPGVTRVVLESFWHLVHTMLIKEEVRCELVSEFELAPNVSLRGCGDPCLFIKTITRVAGYKR